MQIWLKSGKRILAQEQYKPDNQYTYNLTLR
jgi:hypothetical protein